MSMDRDIQRRETRPLDTHMSSIDQLLWLIYEDPSEAEHALIEMVTRMGYGVSQCDACGGSYAAACWGCRVEYGPCEECRGGAGDLVGACGGCGGTGHQPAPQDPEPEPDTMEIDPGPMNYAGPDAEE